MIDTVAGAQNGSAFARFAGSGAMLEPAAAARSVATEPSLSAWCVPP